MINETINNTRKIKNRILAIEAAPAATPPNPKTAAIIAIIRKITVQRNIALNFKGYKKSCLLHLM
jgi:hypothetical protein